MRILIALCCLSLLFVVGCKKEQDDCEKNNYGIAHFTFSGPVLKHRIVIVDEDSVELREKTIAAGGHYDSLHLPVDNWFVKIYSLDTTNAIVTYGTASVNTLQCSNDTVTVDF